MDNPTQNLESLFLNVVEEARASDETSGATSGSEVAEFLRADEPVPTQAEKMLERLADKEAAQPAAQEKAEAAEPETPKVDEAKLDSLSETETEPETKKPEPKAASKKNLDEVDDKLSGLLGD